METKYEVGNNTDYRECNLKTNNKRVAERAWRSVRPRSDAGNLYSAWFFVRCETCGEAQDATVEHETCACARRSVK